ncbi:MAG: type II toxin-antitoxin system RelE/ParE family toxin [Nannocystaceae bacterium]|nr:type II toxin-antitoxin system RelE/ParE family toxin [Nannocystaceae bacterium]
MRVVLTVEARDELREATQWYAERSVPVARRFVAAYRHARGLVVEAPERWPEIEDGIRRVVLSTFPYSLLYVVEQDRVMVLAVKHDRRHPAYCRGRK